MPIKFFSSAREQLLDIWEYTEETWGEVQADRYVHDLMNDIQRIESEKYRWRAVRHESLRGVWFFRHQHHYIFFRQLSADDIGVISILHESMDLPNRLKEDVEREFLK